MNDNVRKVFDMLGVEPDEEFKIVDKNCFWKIDEKLNLYYRQGQYDNGDYVYSLNNSLIINLIENPERIIKLPKESKKLRDITEEEFVKWVVKNCHIGNCNISNNCLFKLVYCAVNTERCWVRNKKIYSDEFLNQEIEVE